MDFKQYTIQAQEIIQMAQQIAFEHQSSAIETCHTLKALLTQKDNIIPVLLKKNQVNTAFIESELDKIIDSMPRVGEMVEAPQQVSKNMNLVLLKLNDAKKKFNDEYVAVEHLLIALLEIKDDTAALLKNAGLSQERLINTIKELRKGESIKSDSQQTTFDALGKYAKNLNELAQNGKLDPVIGRDEEIRRTLHILSRRQKNNPILVGEPGVGKTAIAEGIAFRIVSQDVPENLKNKTVYALDIALLIAGAKYKGEFEERLKNVIKEVADSNGDVILFIDEIHTLVGAGGGGEGAMDAANILKPALARGELRAIGATTLQEYQRYFEKDKALERRFQKVLVDEPSVENAISILRGLKERYETHHHVRIKDEAIIAAVEFSNRYITDRYLPDKAIDIIDESAAKLRLEMNSMPEELDELERKIRQLEIEREAIKREKDEEKVSSLNKQIANLSTERDALRSRWKAEKEVIDKVQKAKVAIENLRLQAEKFEREGNYGAVAEIRYGKIKEQEDIVAKETKLLGDNNSRLIKEEIDADDIADSIARITHIPVNKILQKEKDKLLNIEEDLHKRVIGQEEAISAIGDAVRRNRAGLSDPNKPIGSFLFVGTTGVGKTELSKALAECLFDDERMITRIDMSEYQEKHTVSKLVGAPPGYVGYEEGGQLTEAVRRKPYSVVLLDEIEKAHPDVFNILLQVLDDGRLTDNKGRVANFKNTIIIMTSNLGVEIILENFKSVTNKAEKEKQIIKTKDALLGLFKQTMRPEFLNRIDEIVLFTPLEKAEIKQIVLLQLKSIQKITLKNTGIHLKFSDYVINHIVDNGYDSDLGARPIKRMIQKEIVNALSRSILEGSIKKDDHILVDIFDGVIALRKDKKETSAAVPS